METPIRASQAHRQLTWFSRRTVTIAVLACLAAVQGAASAATYYLNTASGSDGNPGTSSAPWKTLSKVQSSAAAGDTVIIQAADVGTYAAPWPAHVSYKARVLRQFEITWTFDTEYTVGQFANRDLWVVGPVKIIGIDPPSTSVNGRIMNGSMLNPQAGWTSQGYDSAMPNNTYSAALNVAYGRSAGNPLTLSAHSSLISTISLATLDGKVTLQRAAVLTVLAAPAREGDFRPPYCGSDKTPRFNAAMLNRGLLQSLSPVASTPSLASVEATFEAPWIDHQAGWVADQQHPTLNMPRYGREMFTAIGTGALMLHLNFPVQQKETLLRRFVQLGIDLHGIVVNGGKGNWSNDGGIAGGRKWPILFAGILLNDTAMKSVGAKSGNYLYQNGYGPGNAPPDYVHFGEDDQTFYVRQLDVDATNSSRWQPDSRDTERLPYRTSDIGLPEWGIRHSTDPYRSNKSLWTMYRNVAGPPFHGTALAALLTPGGKTLWNHNAYFDYSDRYMAITAPGQPYAGYWRSGSAFTANMWDTYRAQYGPIWPATGGTAPVLVSIADQQVPAGQTLTLTVSATGGSGPLTYSAAGLPAGATFAGTTFTWTPGATQAGSHRVTFAVSDGKAQDAKTITITVTVPNFPPVLATIENKSVYENQLLTFTISATDPDGNAITYSAGGLPSGASLTGQTFSWTPALGQAGSYNVTFTASDGQAQDSQTATITVLGANRPPVLAEIADQSVAAAQLLGFTLAATDPDGDSLTYSVSPLLAGATLTGPTFAWTPTSSQAGSYTVTFTVSDGTLADSQTMTIVVTDTPARDQTAPVVAHPAPAPDAIQVPLNNLVTLHVTDAGTGVDANSVAIRVNGSIIYQGNTDVYTSPQGRCSRSGAKSDYRFIYQPNATFEFDETVAVRVNAADLAGNRLTEYTYSFITEMRLFGRNRSVSTIGGYADSRPATARDPAGNLWVAWHAGSPGSRDIYAARLPVGAIAFETPLRLTFEPADQCHPALAVSAAGVVYVLWQDHRNGNWDLYASVCSNGVSFSNAVQVTNSDRNEIHPALAVDRQTPPRVYVAWQDDRHDNQDIYVASSTDAFATATVAQVTTHAADQKEPAVAVDGGNTAYVFWTDLRNGQADIYAAASNAGPWTNVPIVSVAGDQTQPAVAAGPDTALHLLWVDHGVGNDDIHYARLDGLPGSPVTGINIIDDSSGADQTAPAIVCGDDGKVFACWQDARLSSAAAADADLYVAELRSGTARTNIFVGDDGFNADQSDPALAVDGYGQPYVVWTDSRKATTEIYYAATTLIDPHPVDAKVVAASTGGIVGADPAAIRTPEHVSLAVPPGACPADLRLSISRIVNPPIAALAVLGSYDFGPSGVDFDQPVTVTIPYAVASNVRKILPYWYDSVSGALSQQGITDVENLNITSKLNALRFRTTHFTPFYLIEVDCEDIAGGGAGGGGGCAIASRGNGSPAQLLVPYAGIAAIMLILRRRDRRNRALGQNMGP